MNENDKNILACYVSGPATYSDVDPKTEERLKEKNQLFCTYIWGKFGISDLLKTLRRTDYGKDLHLALFEFYLIPLLEQLIYLKDIGRYRPKRDQ